MVGNGFGMAFDNFYYILDGKIIVMVFLVFVLAQVWWTKNWHISKDVKARRTRGRPYATSMRPKV